GLAAEFGVLDLYGRFDVSTWDPVHLIFEANYVNNVMFDHGEINSKNPDNNRGSDNDPDSSWEGGNQGFLIRATAGDERIDERWDWNVSLAYKYLESDAVPDAFTDSDFHLGGTNAKGYILGGNIGIAKNTFLSLRWLSADEVSGPPLHIDVVQLDLNARF
ncbi:MAG TPA: putative porin, partial [Rhodospirillales bacterium]|nr:putative porin [Rhodospirillales bacterium]